MIRPLDNAERPQGEYVNRIRHTEGGHSATTRDFAYEIGEVSPEKHHKHGAQQEFGEDVYEPSGEETPEPDEAAKPEPKSVTGSDESSLDITI